MTGGLLCSAPRDKNAVTPGAQLFLTAMPAGQRTYSPSACPVCLPHVRRRVAFDVLARPVVDDDRRHTDDVL